MHEIKPSFCEKDKTEEEMQTLPSIHHTTDIVDEIHKNAIMSEVNTNKEIQNKFLNQARKTVHNELNTLDQENIKKRQKATYNANKEACRVYGIEDHVPLWQISFMKVGSSIWFIIYFIFATFTIAPINVFFNGLKTFIKNSVLVFLFSLLCYFIIMIGIPLLFTLLK